jgi:AcrR family transcriptional regulator
MKANRTYQMGARAEAVEATRERIARAAAELFMEQAFEDVTLVGIAKAAGVSHQTVLNHYGSKEGVVLGAVEILGAETMSARSAAEPGDVPGAVHALVGEYERMGDSNFRWAATADRLGDLASLLDDARAGHQAWLVSMFGEALPTSRVARRRAVHALHAATDVYTWKLFRRDLRLSRAETEKLMADLVVGVLEGGSR